MSSPADSRWCVHPLGRAATLRRASAEAVLSGLLGLLALFAIALISGLLVEEVFAETEAATTIDLILRASLVGDLVLGLLGLLALGLLGALEGPLMARALAARMREGAVATAVPIPLQWEAARESSAKAYRTIAIVLLAILGLCYLIVLIATVESGLDAVGLAMTGGGALLIALIAAGIPLTGRAFARWQERHSEKLPQRWTVPHRLVAASRELTAQDLPVAALPGGGARMLSGACVTVFVLAAMAWSTAFEILVAVAFPGSTYTASRQLGERAELSPEGERAVDLLAIAMGVAGVVAVLALVGVVLCTIIGRRPEQRTLRRTLADPAADAPTHALLSRAMAPTSLPALRVLCGVAGASAALGIALWFIDAVAELPDWDHYAAAGPELRAAGVLGRGGLGGGDERGLTCCAIVLE
ncbi:MAG: hypothetical protein L0J57_13185 [Brachybacterium sp.]|nr:hypothetical protein [Brachybacterium sp.]